MRSWPRHDNFVAVALVAIVLGLVYAPVVAAAAAAIVAVAVFWLRWRRALKHRA